MINLIKLDSQNKTSLSKTKKIYESSFPKDERREFNQIITLLNDIRFSFYTINFENELIGIISIWNFTVFTYIEHFAIDEDFRNAGLGTYVLSNILKSEENRVVLEVDIPVDSLSLKRIKFYSKFGFIICKEDYIQPPYSSDKKEVPMLIMSFPEIKTHTDYILIKDTLYKEIYKVPINQQNTSLIDLRTK